MTDTGISSNRPKTTTGHRLANVQHKWKAMTLEERLAWEEALDQEFLNRMRARGEWFMNALVEMSIRQQAPEHRRVKTAFTIDQSAVAAGVHQARWKRDKHGNEVPMRNRLDTTTDEAEGRRVLALEADWAPKKKGAKKRNADEEKRVSRIKWELSYMANVIIDVIEDPDLNKKLQAPQLIRAISLGTPTSASATAPSRCSTPSKRAAMNSLGSPSTGATRNSRTRSTKNSYAVESRS